MAYLFTSESVSEGHPDKVADQISDALLDNFLAFDPESKVACETLVTTGQVVLAGEVKSKTYLDVQQIARNVINDIGYTKGEYQFSGDSCGVISLIHEQSQDINQGVDRANKEEQGAGDQGMMFGYATNETKNFMPLALDISHKILQVLAELRRENKEITYLRPDSKSQVTIEYNDENVPQRIDAIVVSTQHDDFEQDDHKMLAKIKKDIIEILESEKIEYTQCKSETELKDHLLKTVPQDAISTPHESSLRVSQVIKGDVDFYFCVNENEAIIDCNLSIPVIGKPEYWNAESGLISSCPIISRDADRISVPLKLFPRQSIIIAVVSRDTNSQY